MLSEKSQKVRVYLYHSININFKKVKPNLWYQKSELWVSLWEILTGREYMGGEDCYAGIALFLEIWTWLPR